MLKKKTGPVKSGKAFWGVSKWNLLYIVLALLIVFSLWGVPKIVTGAMNRTKGQIITVETQTIH